MQLVKLLLFCAKKVSYQQVDRARNLLNQSSSLFLDRGTDVQRLVYYFADALLERINRVTGRVASEDSWKIRELTHDLSAMNPNRSRISCHQETPFSQIGQLTAIQAIVEKVAGAKVVHAVGLSIGSGAQWAILMQALQNSELELLKTTAIGTLSQHLIEETGRGLESFAGEMNLRFSFRLVMVDELLHLREDHLEVESAETVVVYSQYFLRTLPGRETRSVGRSDESGREDWSIADGGHGSRGKPQLAKLHGSVHRGPFSSTVPTSTASRAVWRGWMRTGWPSSRSTSGRGKGISWPLREMRGPSGTSASTSGGHSLLGSGWSKLSLVL